MIVRASQEQALEAKQNSCEVHTIVIIPKDEAELIDMYYVYILLSEKDPNRYYVGITTDLEERLNRHNNGYESYSKLYAPWKVETYIVFSNQELAFKFEKYLKHGSGQAFLKKRFLPKLLF